ncbi:hypothetical protein E3P99_00069 [Wallemia hederae]|uniref:G-patch domain-containing protein n=1 Tax=Wallemia hederae TaxID=1540922 RepID=A0A4T0FZ14_9BASI|nr:hypothetical protein E3P99_00069 [Wallemia hederae]
MGRKKSDWLRDDGDSSGDDSAGEANDAHATHDEDAEFQLFANPYKRARRGDKQANKDDAMYGVFGSESAGQSQRPSRNRGDVTKWVRRYATTRGTLTCDRAPQFVSSHKPESHDVVHDLEERQQQEEEEREYSSSSSSSEEERPTLEKEDYVDEDDEPSKPQMGKPQPQSQSSNLFAKKPEPVAKAELSRDDQKHFASIQNSFGAKMLAAMGWKAGYGLGEGGKGIAVPIEASKARPHGAGVGSVNERTRAQKMEAKRRGEVVSDDEEDIKEKRRRGHQAQQQEKKSWKSKQARTKTKTQHMTYEEVLEALGNQPEVQTSVGPILDLTGAKPQEVTTSLASHLSSWTPTSDSTKLPELRHNIRLIADESRGQLEGLAREARVINDRRKVLLEQEKAIVKNLDSDIMRIERMKAIEEVVSTLEKVSKEAAVLSTPILDLFTAPIMALLGYGSEYETYRLDEVVVGAITPTFKKLVGHWEPLSEDKTNWIVEMRKWRKALTMNPSPVEKTSLVRRVDADADFKPQLPKTQSMPFVMTPYESMIWHAWLPRLRTALINEWQAVYPLQATRVLDEWTDLLPCFIFDNIMDQLLLPKVISAIDDWTPSSAHSLHSLVFPWLPHLHARFNSVMDLTKRKLGGLLKGWRIDQPPPSSIEVWKAVLSTQEWDNLLLSHVVPKLATHLRLELVINPRHQVYEPLEIVLQWKDILRPKVLAGVLANTFIPKFVDTLYIWLIAPGVNYEQVAAWYAWWKGYFPERLISENSLGDGFRTSLDLINQAMGLGADASKKLVKPTFNPNEKKESKSKAKKEYKEVTFYDVAKEYIEEHNLLLISTRRLHRRGHMLYKVSDNATGKGGILVYIDDDAVWVEPETGGVDKTVLEYIPMSLESVVAKAATH